MDRSSKVAIPDNHVEFCKALAVLCKQHSLRRFSATYSPSFDDELNDDVTFSWNSGRHEEDAGNFAVSSVLRVWATIGD